VLNSSLLDISGLRRELKASMSLLFGRDDYSRALARELFDPKAESLRRRDAKPKKPLTMLPIELYCDVFGATHLRDYQLYRPHLAYIQKNMKEWRPRRFSELFTPGYFDRLTWFTAVFGLVFGLLGALSLVTSIVQVALAVVAWKHPTPL
jgi:hypothetical protein